MSLEFPSAKVMAIFNLAGIDASDMVELANEYWPRVPEYLDLRAQSPWWLVFTEYGPIKIGWRKRVIEIDWHRTRVAMRLTEDPNITHTEFMIHAWSEEECVTRLKQWRDKMEELRAAVGIGPDTFRDEPLTWTTDLPTEPGWYWIRHPDDGDQATMRHLARSHGEWSFDGRLSSEIPSQGYSRKPKRLDTLWMKMVGCKFYGPLRVPK